MWFGSQYATVGSTATKAVVSKLDGRLPPPGLYGPFATGDFCFWNGDFTLDCESPSTQEFHVTDPKSSFGGSIRYHVNPTVKRPLCGCCSCRFPEFVQNKSTRNVLPGSPESFLRVDRVYTPWTLECRTCTDNQEANFYHVYSSNHPERAAAYFGPLLDFVPAAKAQARQVATSAKLTCDPKALNYPAHLAPWGYQYVVVVVSLSCCCGGSDVCRQHICLYPRSACARTCIFGCFLVQTVLCPPSPVFSCLPRSVQFLNTAATRWDASAERRSRDTTTYMQWNGLYSALLFINDWEYTRDVQFAMNTTLPVCTTQSHFESILDLGILERVCL